MRLALILVAALNGLAFSASAQTARNALADLPSAVRDDIARVCLPVQYRDGASAYRDCVTEQLASREESNRIGTIKASIANLSFDDRYAVQQACQAAGPSDSTASQACTAREVAELIALPEPNLDELSTDEHYVMQQTCFNAQSRQGAAAYRQCQLNEITAMSSIAAPDLGTLSAVDRNALQLNCSANFSRLAQYRQCLVDGTAKARSPERTVASVVADSSIPAANTNSATIPVPTATSIQVTKAPQTNEQAVNQTTAIGVTNTASTRPRLIKPPSDQNTVEAVTAREPEPAAALPETSVETQAISTLATDKLLNAEIEAPVQAAIEPSASVESSNDITSVLSTDEPDAQTATAVEPETNTAEAEVTDAGTATATPNGNAATLDNLKNLFSSSIASAKDFFTNLSRQGQYLVAALIATPIALWLLLSGRKRRRYDYEDESDDYSHSRQDLKRRVHADYDDDDHDPIAESWASEADSLFDDDTPTIEREPSFSAEPVTAPRAPVTAVDTENTVVAPTDTSPSLKASGFSGWLMSQPTDEQQSLAIEFLIYWMAYGDERYEPALKQRIFQDPDPSNHDIVKRWVLKEDVHAFADVIEWVQRHTTAVQKEQIVQLLMALLINGESPTPVQNTLLRFLGDVFFLTNPSLDEIFELDFAQSLPAIPRVDRLAWWDRQSPGAVSLWDARTLNASDEITRYAAQLGVGGDARAEHVEAAYRRAVNRCSPDRFDQLGEREHQLIASRRGRLVEARDELMEALA